MRFVTMMALWTIAAGAGAQPDPWAPLEQVRGRLAAAGPRVAEFDHHYVPAGFSQGEKETGRLALSLPDCLRWDYGEPYPKSFLVCGNLAHYWNSEDKAGRRLTIDSQSEPGLDLLLLPTEQLKSRYQARAESLPGGQVRLHLTPLRPLAEIKDATLTLDTGGGVVTGIAYLDLEGNRTEFVIKSYSPLADTHLFSPPEGIAWTNGE